MKSTQNSKCGCVLSAAKIVLKKEIVWNSKPLVIRVWIFEQRCFLLYDRQSTMQLMSSFSKHNYLTSDMLWSMLVLNFIIFGLAEVEDN